MRAKKHLGQHFLRDRNAVARIVAALEARQGDHVLEIGPGPATLTRPLHEAGYRLTLVETDPEMTAFLRETGFDPPVEIVEADFLEVDLDRVLGDETRVVSNLPYNVSVPITARLLQRAERIPTMVLMYQKEVAERVRAEPDSKTYGPISVLVGQLYTCDLAFNVKPGAFHPPPKVMSQVIRLRRREQPLITPAQLETMTSLVRFLFTHRRKMLSARLKSWSEGWTNVETLLESLKKCSLDPRARPENLSPADYATWLNGIEGG